MNPLENLQASLADRYKVEREIGVGGMATVYLAKDLRHDRDVALKLLKPELGAVLGPERFLSEIRVTAKLQHPNLLPLFDSGEANGQLWYVMPYVPGETLRARLERERQLPVKEAVRIAVLVAGALDYAHRQGIVHRDLKPENILLQDGQPLLADFGIALAVSKVAGERMTQTGLSLGTPQYMSPEQAMGERTVDARSDIYSLGAVLYEMLTGEPPFTGPTTQAVVAKLITETPRSVRAARPAVPAGLDAAVMRALEKIPADRFESAREFAQALENESIVSGATAAAQANVGKSDAARGKMKYALPVAAVLVTIVVVLLARSVLQSRSASSAPPGGTAAVAADTAKSVAVLPFVNVGGDPKQEYFSDGITDEISDALSRIPRLRIASRTSSFAFKGRNAMDARAIGKQLNVSALLEGQVLRAGDRLRVSAQLTDAFTGIVKWRSKYERDLKDVFAVQDEIARSIASALQVTLSDSVRIVSGTTNLAAHDLYLRGRFEQYKYDEASLRQAIALYDSATRLDPGYADAYVGSSEAWSNLADDWVAPAIARPRALAAAKRALALDPTSGSARAAYMFADLYNPDQAYVRREVEDAVRHAPNNAVTGLVAAIVIAPDDPAYALELAKGAYTLDSATTLTAFSYGYILHMNGRSAEVPGIEAGIIQREPPAVLPRYIRADAELALGHTKEALADYLAISPYLESAASAGIGRAYVALGDTARALEMIHKLQSESRKHYVSKDYIAEVFAAMGQRDSAFKWLAGAVADNSSYVRTIYVDPKWKPLRGDPRLAQLANQMHVPVR